MILEKLDLKKDSVKLEALGYQVIDSHDFTLQNSEWQVGIYTEALSSSFWGSLSNWEFW